MSLRVIGGSLRGRRLFTPKDEGTRPSAGRLREAVFNIIGPEVVDSVVLDLFAGSGALGIEALSRGARQAVFIDNRHAAIKEILRNIDHCQLNSRAVVVRWDIRRSLACLASRQERFDLVFMDPPYGHSLTAIALDNLLLLDSLVPGALIVIEHETGERVAHASPRFEPVDQRRYGKSLVSFVRFVL